MNPILQFDFEVDKSNKRINVKREFSAPVELVWRAWTEPEIIDQWWAPKPYKTETKSQDLKPGGRWMYAMVSPEGEKHWCIADYKTVVPYKSYSGLDAFCDENGNINPEFPRSLWEVKFEDLGEKTLVSIQINYEKLEDLEQVITLGFKEGFTMAMGNLDAYIYQRFKLRSELKKDRTARVVNYLNFPGNTEEAFTFYKKVFKSEFSGKGLQRFGEIPAESGHPPVSEAIKNMILHVELPILGNYILMATDAPKEMGFELIKGNNMHICLEPETREETKRLFDELSEGGTVIMPMADMFFGAYFGECRDKFGISWMFNFVNN